MSRIEIASLEPTRRPVSGFVLPSFDGHTHFAEVLTALLPAVGILAVAATLLLAIL